MNKKKFLPVIDNKDLVRDLESKAILFTNKQVLEDHRNKRKFFKDMVKQSEEISNLKEDIKSIKELLTKLLEK